MHLYTFYLSLYRCVIFYGNVIRHSFQNVLNFYCHPWYKYDWTDVYVYISPSHGPLSLVFELCPSPWKTKKVSTQYILWTTFGDCHHYGSTNTCMKYFSDLQLISRDNYIKLYIDIKTARCLYVYMCIYNKFNNPLNF